MGASQRRQATAGEEGARERGQREELLAVDENRRSLFLLYYVSFGSIIGLFCLYNRTLLTHVHRTKRAAPIGLFWQYNRSLVVL